MTGLGRHPAVTFGVLRVISTFLVVLPHIGKENRGEVGGASIDRGTCGALVLRQGAAVADQPLGDLNVFFVVQGTH